MAARIVPNTSMHLRGMSMLVVIDNPVNGPSYHHMLRSWHLQPMLVEDDQHTLVSVERASRQQGHVLPVGDDGKLRAYHTKTVQKGDDDAICG